MQSSVLPPTVPIVVWRKEPKMEKCSFLFWAPVDEKCTRYKNVTKLEIYISHRETTPTRNLNRCPSARFAPKHKCLLARSLPEWSCPHRNSSPSKKWQSLAWATRRSRPRWAGRSRRRSGGCGGSARKARWCRTTLGDHVVRRPTFPKRALS